MFDIFGYVCELYITKLFQYNVAVVWYVCLVN